MRRVSSSNARSQSEPTLLVFGIDRKRKARAAWFGSDDEPQAAKVAERAGYVTCKLTPDIRRDLSARVPSGRVSRSGRVFAPVVPAEVYRDLLQAAGASTRPTVDEPSASDSVESGDVRTDGCSPPSGDSALIPGADARAAADECGACSEQSLAAGTVISPNGLPVVVASTPTTQSQAPADWDSIVVGNTVLVRDPESEGWYEAIVLEALGEVFRLRFRDYKEPAVTRRRNEIALLYPG
jgi:hypothetical protein